MIIKDKSVVVERSGEFVVGQLAVLDQHDHFLIDLLGVQEGIGHDYPPEIVW